MSGIVGDNTGRGSGTIKSSGVGADDITGAEIADDSIDSEHYVDGSIDNAHIADDAIDSEHYAAASIDEPHLADNSVDSRAYVDGSIDPEHLADNAVTLAKMASGTDGNIISYDASGNPVAIATGTDGQVLTSAGAGAPPVFEDAGGGAWTLIGTQVASNDASLTQTGLSSTYGSYAIVLSDVTIATNAAHVVLRIGDSGGIDSGGSDYKYHTMASNTNTSGYAAENSAGASYVVIGEYIGNGSGRGYHGIVFLGNHTSLYPTIHGNYGGIDNSGFGTGSSFFGLRNASITVDRVQVLCSAGNLLTGRFSVFGIKHT